VKNNDILVHSWFKVGGAKSSAYVANDSAENVASDSASTRLLYDAYLRICNNLLPYFFTAHAQKQQS